MDLAMRVWKRDESRQVPAPKIFPWGYSGPAILAAIAVMMSQGLLTIKMVALGLYLRTSGMIICMILAFLPTKLRRDSPGFCANPAVMTTRSEPSLMSYLSEAKIVVVWRKADPC